MSFLDWFDADPNKHINTKIRDALTRYRTKFETEPTIVYIHPSQHKNIGMFGLQVDAKQTVMPNHVWVGIVNQHIQRRIENVQTT